MGDLPANYASDALALHAVDTDEDDGLYAVYLSGRAMATVLTAECPICAAQPSGLCMARDGRTFGLEHVHESRVSAVKTEGGDHG